MLQTIKNERGFVGVAALCLIATATAFVGGAAYLDHSGKGIDFSLINPETADSVGAAGRENRMMAEDFISGYSDFQRENNRTIESLTSTYLVEYDQLRADLRQSEAAHRASIEGSNNLILFILVGIVGLLSWLFISAARHPRNLSAGPRNISGRPEAFRLEDGSVLFIDGHGQRTISRPKDPVGLLRNERGSLDIVTALTAVVVMLIILMALSMSGTITDTGDSGEIRAMAETLNAQSMEQIDRMAGYMMQANESHVSSLRSYAGAGMDLLFYVIIGGLTLFIAVAGLILFLLSSGKMTIAQPHQQPKAIEREREVVYLVRDHAGDLHRIDHQHVEQIPAERRALLGHYDFNERGNTNIRLAAIVFLVAAMAIFAIKYIGGIDALTGSPAKAQPANVMVNDVSGVAIMFIRNPHGNPVQKYCVMYADGEAAEVNKGVADAAIRQLVGKGGKGGNGVRQMGGVR